MHHSVSVDGSESTISPFTHSSTIVLVHTRRKKNHFQIACNSPSTTSSFLWWTIKWQYTSINKSALRLWFHRNGSFSGQPTHTPLFPPHTPSPNLQFTKNRFVKNFSDICIRSFMINWNCKARMSRKGIKIVMQILPIPMSKSKSFRFDTNDRKKYNLFKMWKRQRQW